MRNLEVKEIEEVNGGLGNFAVGAIAGGALYLLGGAYGGSISLGGFTGAVVAGAYTSGFSALAGGGRVANAIFGANGVGIGSGVGLAVNGTINNQNKKQQGKSGTK
ncbi:hypothetical protein ABW636_08265 [Aquimarina sp. 2201CG1-2-11]|uniref:hypothetical protein n=1 Tax=Aquimarina discodermiae TaxID=3231043 RepID=UPI003462FF4A